MPARFARGVISSIALTGTMLGCGGSSSSGEPTIPEDQVPLAPALESVPFQLLGAGKVAFERLGGDGGSHATYVIDASAARSTHVFDAEIAFGPALSPDGRRLAYAALDFGNGTGYDVYVANVDGTGVQQVTRFPDNEGPPTWTPDGSRIVVAAGGGGGLLNVYSQSPAANAGDQTQLTHFTITPGVPLTCPVLTLSDVGVVISADGRMAFACSFGEIDVSTNGTFAIAYQPSRTDRRKWPNVFAPAWSPDGTRIAFIETTSDSATNYTMLGLAVKLMNADGSGVTTLASIQATAGSDPYAGASWLGYNNLSLCWMPDGSRLVFNMPESSKVGHLWVVRADGSGLTQITTAPGAWDRSVSCSR